MVKKQKLYQRLINHQKNIIGDTQKENSDDE